MVQLITIAGICTLGALPEGIALPATPGAWGSLLYTVLFASIFAIRAQTWTQAQVSATRAAVVMTLEPVFAALFAVALGARRPP